MNKMRYCEKKPRDIHISIQSQTEFTIVIVCIDNSNTKSA